MEARDLEVGQVFCLSERSNDAWIVVSNETDLAVRRIAFSIEGRWIFCQKFDEFTKFNPYANVRILTLS